MGRVSSSDPLLTHTGPKIAIQTTGGTALTKQKSVDMSNFPFTMNTGIGCLYGCPYCYLQSFPFNLHTEFGNEIKIKAWLPEQLDLELEKWKDLPQHLKRVQVNAATEGYLPQAILAMESEYNRDLMKEVLEVFRKHWNAGNKWMVHLVTKSHLILNHLDLISEMKDQVQIELTITTLDEAKARLLEGSAPSVKKRLQVVERFAKNDVFVRAMVMPFIGSEAEANNVRKVLLDLGAKGFKHKAMNYWDEEMLLQGEVVRKQGKRDLIYRDLHLNSGETVLNKSGNETVTTVSMPDSKWNEFTEKPMKVVTWGYCEMNDVDWKYIK